DREQPRAARRRRAAARRDGRAHRARGALSDRNVSRCEEADPAGDVRRRRRRQADRPGEEREGPAAAEDGGAGPRPDGQREDRRRHQGDLSVGRLAGDQEGSDQRALPAEQRACARRARPRREGSADEKGDRLEDVGDVEEQGSDRLSAGAAEVTARGLAACGWGMAVALTASAAGAQTLDAKIRAAATPGAVTWVGYRLPKVPGHQTMCGGERERTNKVILEGPREIEVLARIENGVLTWLRTVTPDCEIDASGATLVWLTGVTAPDSAAWLESLVSGAAASRETTNHVTDPALAALAMQAGEEAGAVALPTIAAAVDTDPEVEVKRRAVFALSQLPKDEGVPKLIEIARSHRNAEVRKQAFFWLGQSKDPRAVAFFEEVLTKR